MGRALITGITGFAGSHLASYLLRNDLGPHGPIDERILGCSRFGRWPINIPEALRQIPILTGELTDLEQHKSRIADFQPDWIFHLAAMSVPADCGAAEPSELAWKVNVSGTRTVLELANTLPQKPRVVVASSS